MPRPETFYEYLDRTKTAHNGKGSEDWVRYTMHGDQFGRPVSISALAYIFNVTRPTIYDWKQREMRDSVANA